MAEYLGWHLPGSTHGALSAYKCASGYRRRRLYAGAAGKAGGSAARIVLELPLSRHAPAKECVNELGPEGRENVAPAVRPG